MNQTDLEIRPIAESDLEAVSIIISRCLREVNSTSYSEAQIAKLLEKFTVEQLRLRFQKMQAFVAVWHNQILGTGALEENFVKTVFINPDNHRQRIGWQLMLHIEDIARKAKQEKLQLHSSLNARYFYEQLGYRVIKEVSWDEGSPLLAMEKQL